MTNCQTQLLTVMTPRWCAAFQTRATRQCAYS